MRGSCLFTSVSWLQHLTSQAGSTAERPFGPVQLIGAISTLCVMSSSWSSVSSRLAMKKSIILLCTSRWKGTSIVSNVRLKMTSAAGSDRTRRILQGRHSVSNMLSPLPSASWRGGGLLDIQEEVTFFAFTHFKIHLRTKCVFNICQLIIFNVLTLFLRLTW